MRRSTLDGWRAAGMASQPHRTLVGYGAIPSKRNGPQRRGYNIGVRGRTDGARVSKDVVIDREFLELAANEKGARGATSKMHCATYLFACDQGSAAPVSVRWKLQAITWSHTEESR